MTVFQNGRCVLPPQITTEGRLHLQAGQEKCLFRNFNASLIKKLSSFLMFTESLLPLRFKMGPALRIFTKALKIIGEDKDSDNEIFGQKPTLAYDGRDSHFHTHYNFPPLTFGFCSKYEDAHFGFRRMS